MTKIRNFVELQQQSRKDKTLFEKMWMNMEFGRSPICYFAYLLEVFYKRFSKDPNVNVQNAIPLFEDISSSDNNG